MNNIELFAELFDEVGKVLLQEGEAFRLEHAELLDIYSRLCEMKEVRG